MEPEISLEDYPADFALRLRSVAYTLNRRRYLNGYPQFLRCQRRNSRVLPVFRRRSYDKLGELRVRDSISDGNFHIPLRHSDNR
jgi:hypothetical protein